MGIEFDYDQLVRSIASFNRVWKHLRERESPIAPSLRERKSELQLRLLNQFPDSVELVKSSDNDEHEEPMLTLSLKRPVQLRSGVILHDAMHLPMRIGIEHFIWPADAMLDSNMEPLNE